MNNYKIKVSSEAESKEAQELFESIGYEKGACSLGNYPAVIVTTQDWETGNYCSTRALGLDIPAHESYKEITLPELRDMVVLKRNDQKDRTHVDSNSYDWYVASDEKHYRHQGSIWVHQPYVDCLDLKPIEKEEMKEYLDANRNYEFVLSSEKEEGFIEIPNGANSAICGTHGDIAFFFDFDFPEGRFKSGVVIWQRATQPEELPFIDDEPRRSSFMTPEQQGRFTEGAKKVAESFVKLSKGLNIHEPQSLNDQYAEIEQVRQDMVNHPNHYTQGKVECIDALEAATVGKVGIEAVCVANVIKYLWRYEEKNGKEDVKKAQWYLNKLLNSID